MQRRLCEPGTIRFSTAARSEYLLNVCHCAYTDIVKFNKDRAEQFADFR